MSRPPQKNTYLPLQGVRVIELASLLPAPLLARKLADLGAEVLKIEPPEGDPARAFEPLVEGRSLLFEAANRGKASMTLDLRSEADRARLLSLIAVTDVVIESQRPGRLARRGIDWAVLRRERPALVVCSFTGFGQTGPLAGLPAHGLNVEALAGCVTVAGSPSSGYSFATEIAWAIECAAVNGALAAATAALHARASGEGVWIDASAWDAGVEAHRWFLYPLLAGRSGGGLEDKFGPLHALYEAADGRLLVLMASERRFWSNFCAGVDRPDLMALWRASDGEPDSDAAATALRPELTALFQGETAAVWAERFTTWDVPGCEVLAPQDVVTHPHFAARDLATGDDVHGIPGLADPIRFEDVGTRPGQGAAPAPDLDDHADVAERWLGRTNH